MSFLDKYASLILGITRIVAALLFIEHGLVKLVGFPISMGMGPTPPLMLAAAVIEIICGALIALGLFSRIAAFICSGEMAVGYFLIHARMGFYPVVNKGEAAILFCFLFLYLAAAGPGALAINRK